MSFTGTFVSDITFAAILLYSTSDRFSKTLVAECLMGVVLAQTNLAPVISQFLHRSPEILFIEIELLTKYATPRRSFFDSAFDKPAVIPQ